MKNPADLPSQRSFFKLPLEPNTFRLRKETLNSYSEFRRQEKPYFPIEVRTISFRNAILTLAVKLKEEAGQQVFIQVREKELLVSCSVDTCETFLSRYAYFALIGLMDISNYYDFSKFYWPDFFESKTGGSKYLHIINDRLGMEVSLKPKYPYFYRPGLKLPSLSEEPKSRIRNLFLKQYPDQVSSTSYEIGYCLADTNLRSLHSNHFPFLVPYLGVPTKNKESIKSYTEFINCENDIQLLSFSPIQEQLNEICFKMRELAPIESSLYKIHEEISNEEERNVRLLFDLWLRAHNLIISQRFLRYTFTYGLANLKGKPGRDRMLPCEISSETPQLVFRKVDKRSYYQLELRFKVSGKTYVPFERNTAFFINAVNAPQRFYLLDNYADYQLTSFFALHGFTIAVLKGHYNDDFRDFVDLLAKRYQLKESYSTSIVPK